MNLIAALNAIAETRNRPPRSRSRPRPSSSAVGLFFEDEDEGRGRERGGVAGHFAALALLLLLCGCLQTKDELTLEADGSGKVRIETRTSISGEMLGGLGHRPWIDEGLGQLCPPITEAEAKKWFPGKDFLMTVKEEKTADNDRVLLVEVAFKDVNALLVSPYGSAHALSLKIEAGKFVLRALSAMEAAARLAEMKDDQGMFGMELPGLADLQKKKDLMRSEFRVTLPGAVAAGNGARDGRTVTWIEERAKYTNATEFAQKLGSVLEASCAADALKFSPVTPPRLALLPFKELPAGATADKGVAPDAKRVLAAAKFVPYALHVTRSLDLSGEGGSHENQAQLIGAVVLPREFKPQKWGEARLEEVVDAKGNSLKLEEGRGGFFPGGRFAGMEEDEDEDEKPPTDAAEERNIVSLQFQPPDWKVKEIARIKGSISLQYLGTSQRIVKLTNAVPAKWIKQDSNEPDTAFDNEPKTMSDPALPEIGLSLNFQMGMAQSGFTMLMLQVGGNKSVLSDAQVFDAEGRPWPTFLQQEAFGNDGSCSITVAGRPAAPLSLALLATGVGANVEVPILLEKVPVARK